MKIYERELPQKQYHWATSGYFHVPRNHKPSPGDRYISDLPIDLKWEDEPYDILENGLVRKEDFKIWPDFRKC